MRVLSLFDGMACGMLAMQMAGIEVERYVAYEIDKYAIKTSTHNFPMIEQRGDVFAADFTEFEGFDFLVGGSPCTYWSIAKKVGRETEASGMGWELFCQYVRALHEAKPKFFVYENNKSMHKAIRESIDKAFGFEAVCINSALVSAQNRQRLYWVGKRNEDGTYSKVPIEQPEDLGILLKDILESGTAEAKPVRVPGYGIEDKSRPLSVSYAHKGSGEGSLAYDAFPDNPNKQVFDYVAEPVAMRQVGRRINENGHRDDYNENIQHVQRHEVNENPQKTNCLTTVTKDNMVAEPICLNSKSGRGGVEGLQPSLQDRIYSIEGKRTAVTTVFMPKIAELVRVGALPRPNGELSTSQAFRVYSTEGKSVNLTAQGGGAGAKTGLYAIPCCNMIVKEATKKGYTEIEPMACVDMTQPNSQTRRGRNMADKSNCCMTSCQHYQYCGVLAYATPCEWDDDGKVTNGKTYTVYEVKDGKITIKGKQYPIKLIDGFYIIRKPTVREFMRLQTVPEWYEFPVSDSQAYKMLGNGWTCRVIEHLLRGCMAALDQPAPEKEPKRVVVKRINKQEE